MSNAELKEEKEYLEKNNEENLKKIEALEE